MNYRVEIRTPYGTVAAELSAQSYRQATKKLQTIAPEFKGKPIEFLWSILRVYQNGEAKQRKHGKL